MKFINIIRCAQTVVETAVSLACYPFLGPNRFLSLCECILNHNVHGSIGAIHHCNLEEFLNRECGMQSEIIIDFWWPIVQSGRGILISEALSLQALVKAVGAKRCFEIGTFRGWTSYVLASAMGEDCELFTLDIPPQVNPSLPVNEARDCYHLDEDDTGSIFQAHRDHRANVIQLWGDSASFDFSPYKHKMDLVFIDGAHTEVYVESDSINAFKMVRNGGLIVWHDYKASCPGVVRFLSNLAKETALFYIEETAMVVCKVKNAESFLLNRIGK